MLPSRSSIFCMIQVLFFLTGIVTISYAETDQAGPIHIEADRMEADQQRDLVVFTGNVEANQADIAIFADEMVVNYLTSEKQKTNDNSDKKLSQRIDKIDARGNVKIVKGDWIATGDSMEYYSSAQKVKLTGNAKAWQDSNVVTGENIILFLEEGRSIVEKSGKDGKRVKAFIYSGGTSSVESKKE